MFQTLTDTLQSYDGKAFVFFFGPTQGQELVPESKCLVAEAVDMSTLQAVFSIPTQAFADGIVMVISTRTYQRDRKAIDAIQQSLAHFYCKHVEFPKRQSTIPDTHSVTEEVNINIVLEINKLRNMEFFVRSPLCDKLQAARIRQPVFIAMPGPSLTSLAPKLAEIGRKCLTICVPKTLGVFLDNGVEPDFVVLLDTDERMQCFFPRRRRFPNTYLVPLSLAAISEYANNFRGIFFMDSFDPSVLKNDFRLRESWLSGFTACFGLAEALGAPHVFIAGADHSWKDWEPQYAEQTIDTTPPPSPRPYPEDTPAMVVSSSSKKDGFPMADVQGNEVHSCFHYFATSVESKVFADAIRNTNTTHFHNLSQSGILDPSLFELNGWAALDELPSVERRKFRFKADVALSIREEIDTTNYTKTLKGLIESLCSQRAQMIQGIIRNDIEAFQSNPLIASLKQRMDEMKAPYFPTLNEQVRAMHAQYSRQWLLASLTARAWLHVYAANKAGNTVDILCLEHEADEALSRLKTLFPDLRPKLHSIWSEAYIPAPTRDDITPLQYNHTYLWFREQTAVLVTRGAYDQYDFLLERVNTRNWVVFDLPTTEGQPNG